MFEIQQQTKYLWEVISEGEFETREEAEAAVSELEKNLGWEGLRIVERADA